MSMIPDRNNFGGGLLGWYVIGRRFHDRGQHCCSGIPFRNRRRSIAFPKPVARPGRGDRTMDAITGGWREGVMQYGWMVDRWMDGRSSLPPPPKGGVSGYGAGTGRGPGIHRHPGHVEERGPGAGRRQGADGRSLAPPPNNVAQWVASALSLVLCGLRSGGRASSPCGSQGVGGVAPRYHEQLNPQCIPRFVATSLQKDPLPTDTHRCPGMVRNPPSKKMCLPRPCMMTKTESFHKGKKHFGPTKKAAKCI